MRGEFKLGDVVFIEFTAGMDSTHWVGCR